MPIDWWNMDPSTREAETVSLLDELPGTLEAALIGGYAVAAYAPARFSVDVDLVIPSRTRFATRAWFEAHDFRVKMTMNPSPATDHLGKFKIAKDPVAGDIYIDGVRDRSTGAALDYEWLSRSSRRIRLSLTTCRTKSPVLVVRPEAMWALKLLAARTQDLTDLFAMMDEPVHLVEVRSKLKAIPFSTRKEAAQRAVQFVRSDREYRDALSRRSLGSPSSKSNLQSWARFQKAVETVVLEE